MVGLFTEKCLHSQFFVILQSRDVIYKQKLMGGITGSATIQVLVY